MTLNNPTALRRAAAIVFLGFSLAAVSATGLDAAQPFSYLIDLTRSESHLVGVTLSDPRAGPKTEIQFPAWNALYQIRDFIRHVQDLRAECGGKPLALEPVGLYTFSTGGAACSPLVVRYQVFANDPGVFSSELIPHHAFLNFAEILFYVRGERGAPDQVRFVVPAGWKLITLLPGPGNDGTFSAPNYDTLVDSPVEAGQFNVYSYSQGGALYRIVVRGDDESASQLNSTVEKITAAETALMRDRPFSRYTFIFHFPETGSGAGMEHSDGAAISFPAPLLVSNWSGLEDIIAHEFFHLWNVKRIRPQGLVPVDYIHGNNTRDLWFSEGVTSTYAELVLLRAGLISRDDFYDNLASAIARLQSRPARRFQSVELAGIDAWLEKYPDYFRAERSISYYNKGELLGYLLDLGIRHASANVNSLDDLMRRLNVDFAKRGRYFTDRDLENLIVSFGPSREWAQSFFENYVDGTRELDYPAYLGYAGLELSTSASAAPDWGFQAAKEFSRVIRVTAVDPGSDAARAGIREGDVLEALDGQTLYAIPANVSGVKPGTHVKLRVRRGSRSFTLKFKLGSREITTYSVQPNPAATPQEIALRDGWLAGTTARGNAAAGP